MIGKGLIQGQNSIHRLIEGLADLRSWRTANGLQTPGGGLWWDDAESHYVGRYASWKCCSICGPATDGPEGIQLRLDHCHQTGLYRGILCNACNLMEGRFDGPRWHVWRLAAPNLQVGRRTIYKYERYTREIHSDDLYSKPMSNLLKRVNMFCIRDKRLSEVIAI